MSRSQMQQARKFISEKRYDEARVILREINDPRARQLLAQLDKKQPRSRRSFGIRSLLTYLLTIVLSALLTIGVLAVLVVMTAPARGVARTEAVASYEATTVAEANLPTATPTPIPRMGQVVSAQNINVRANPNTGAEVVAALLPGTSVEVLSETDDGSWYQVQLENRTVGWIAANLLAVDAPSPTDVPVPDPDAQAADAGATEDVTPTPVAICEAAEAQAWYDANQHELNLARYTLMQAQADSPDYARLEQIIRDAGISYETSRKSGETLPCIQSISDDGYNAMVALLRGWENYGKNNDNAAAPEITKAQQLLDQMYMTLADELGVNVGGDRGCEANIWYAGLRDDMLEYLALLDMTTAQTRPSEEVRAAIFTLQAIDGRAGGIVPDCAQQASTHYRQSVQASVRVFQGIMAEDTNAVQTHLATAVNERRQFLEQMRQLNLSVEPAAS